MAGIALQPPDRLDVIIVPCEIPGHLPIAQPFHGAQMTSIPIFQEMLRFPDQPLGQLRLHAGFDPPVESLAFPDQTDQQGRIRRLGRRVSPVRVGQRATQQMMYLQRPDDLHVIMRMQPVGRFGVHARQCLVEIARVLLARFPHQSLAKVPVRGRSRPQSPDQRPHVQSRSPHHQGNPSCAVQSLDLGERLPAVDTNIERLIRLHQIDQPVRDALPLLRSRFVRSDIHAPIDLTGVSREHLSSQRFCDEDPHLTLPDRRRTDDDDQRLQPLSEK